LFFRRLRLNETLLGFQGRTEVLIRADREEDGLDRGGVPGRDGSRRERGDEWDRVRLTDDPQVALLDRAAPFEQRLGVTGNHGGDLLAALGEINHLRR